MTDAEKLAKVQEALKLAMSHWAAWCDESRGVHPTELGEGKDWQHCEAMAFSWTSQAQGMRI